MGSAVLHFSVIWIMKCVPTLFIKQPIHLLVCGDVSVYIICVRNSSKIHGFVKSMLWGCWDSRTTKIHINPRAVFCITFWTQLINWLTVLSEYIFLIYFFNIPHCIPATHISWLISLEYPLNIFSWYIVMSMIPNLINDCLYCVLA